MNLVVIILGVIVIILIYVLIQFFMEASVELAATANLNDSINGIPIKNNPTSSRYAYGVWIYVNSWNMGGTKPIMARSNNLALRLDENSPVLLCDITMNNDEIKTIEFTDNFPLQKWVHVLVNVDNQYVDCYLDGKLIKSGRAYIESSGGIVVPKQPPAGGNDGVNLQLGGSAWDAYVARVKHWSNPVNPEEVWSTYMDGNGQGAVGSWLSKYGLDILIKKDNMEHRKLTLI